jgi:hypothetical protein
MLNVGKLYRSEYYLMLYPDKKTARFAASSFEVSARSAAKYVDLLNRDYRKKASVIKNKVPFLVLNISNEYVEVLVGDRKGWIVFAKSLRLKEIR